MVRYVVNIILLIRFTHVTSQAVRDGVRYNEQCDCELAVRFCRRYSNELAEVDVYTMSFITSNVEGEHHQQGCICQISTRGVG